jgi:hypothetical protein
MYRMKWNYADLWMCPAGHLAELLKLLKEEDDANRG